MTRPDERRFTLFQRGYVRDQIILAHMRAAMRTLVNPDTDALFTEDEITRLTQSGSRYYIQADAIDFYGQAVQARDSYFADQIIPTRSNGEFLFGAHGPLWLPEGMLTASGASGTVNAPGTPGVIWPGSTTIGDPAATVGVDPNGNSYQVLINVTTPGNGIAPLTLVALDGGEKTNIAVGTPIKWRNPPIGVQPEAPVATAFTGGVDAETDADFAKRIEDRIRHRPASGNQAHFRAWAQQSSNAVEQAFVYACALNSGSVVVCITQKRSNVQGPLARIPSFGTMSAAIGYLVPPNSPVVPGNVFVLVVPPNSVPSDLSLRIALRRATPGGWADQSPWPKAGPSVPRAFISTVTDQQTIVISADPAYLPPGMVGFAPLVGVQCPQMMVWRNSTSSFEKLVVDSVSYLAPGSYQIDLASAISTNDLAVGDVISPYTDRLAVVAQAVQQYFDGIGPGELVDLNPASADLRAHRAYRYPKPSEGSPQKAGQGIVTTILEVLGGVASDAELFNASVTSPSLPVTITDGPGMLTLGQLGIYDPDN